MIVWCSGVSSKKNRFIFVVLSFCGYCSDERIFVKIKNLWKILEIFFKFTADDINSRFQKNKNFMKLFIYKKTANVKAFKARRTG